MTTRRSAAADDAKAILNRIRQLVRALRAFEKEAQRRFGLGAAQMFILHVLAHEDQLSLNDVAGRTATDQSSVSLAVGRLVEDGYVRREVSREDRRQIELSLTAKGRALARRSPPAAQETILSGVEAMSATERARLVRLLDKLMKGMGEQAAGLPMLFQDGNGSRKSGRTAGTSRSRR